MRTTGGSVGHRPELAGCVVVQGRSRLLGCATIAAQLCCTLEPSPGVHALDKVASNHGTAGRPDMPFVWLTYVE